MDNTLPALVGSGLVGLIFVLTKQRPLAWILLMMLTIVLVAAGTQTVWELFPQLRHGWDKFFVTFAVATVFSIPFSFLMQRICKKRGHDA